VGETARRDESEIRVGNGALSVVVPQETPAEAVEEIERLLDLIDTLADRTAQLHVALDSRVAIEQAKGVLAERLGVSPDDAFQIMRRTARSRRVPLQRLASAIVRGADVP
jgi:AmiR/NasT family two-component response regulator